MANAFDPKTKPDSASYQEGIILEFKYFCLIVTSWNHQ